MDEIGKFYQTKRRGLVDFDQLYKDMSFNKKKVFCSQEHTVNPNFPKRTQSIAVYANLTNEDAFRVNPKHRITEEKALSLPMNRRLRQHFAHNACRHAMAKFNIKDPEELKLEEIEERKRKKEEEAAAKLEQEAAVT